MPVVLERSENVLKQTPQDVEGYYFPTREEAIAETIQILRGTTDGNIVYYDIDDSLLRSERWLRWHLNQTGLKNIPGFQSVSLKTVIDSGGRYYQVPAYQQMAEHMGVRFSDMFAKEVATNTQLHSLIGPHRGAQHFQETMRNAGYKTSGYATARPHELGLITGASLRYHGFDKAPVIDVLASYGDPEEGKARFFTDAVIPNIPSEFKGLIVFLDDHPKTALLIKEKCNNRVTPLVPIVPRNSDKIEELKANGIKCGTFQELEEYITSFK